MSESKGALKALAINYISARLDNLVNDCRIDTEKCLLTFTLGKQSIAAKLQDISKHGDVLNEICVQKYLSMLSQGYLLYNYKSGWLCEHPDEGEIYQVTEDSCTCGDFCFRRGQATFIGCKHQLMQKGFMYFYNKTNAAKLRFIERN
jgi:hypothetical protein